MIYFVYNDIWMNFKKKYAMWKSQSQNTTYLMIEVASLMAQMVKSLLAVHKTWVRSLGPEDPLEKEMATHSSILAWKIPQMEETGRLRPLGRKVLDMTEQLH